MRRRLVIAATLLLATAAYLAYRWYRIEQFGRQVKNWSNGRALVEILREEHRRTGAYPLAVTRSNPAFARFRGDTAALVDPWGHPYLYFSDGEKFVLVSCGSDGVPDRSDYWSVRNEPMIHDRARNYSICSRYSEDQVLSDRGYHRFCGK